MKLPTINDYWRKDGIFHYQAIANRITRDRFYEIHRYLHFVDNSTLAGYGEPDYDKLGKVRPILTVLNERFLEVYQPGCHQSIDEAMVPFKGRSSLKQYMPKKPVKRGFKIWMRADGKNGYVSEFEVYTGKKGDQVEKGLGEGVVRRLTHNILNRNHQVYFDNFFTSINLLVYLLKNGTYASGTLRTNRVGFPCQLKQFIKKGLPKRGDNIIVQSGPVAVSIWQDTKHVFSAFTNTQPNSIVTVTRKQKNGSQSHFTCPEGVQLYNKYMGGVDRNDQMRSYSSIRLRSNKYYKYLFWALFDVSITNSIILCRNYTDIKPNTIKDLRVSLAKGLIATYNSRKRKGRPTLTPTKKFCSDHFPIHGDSKVHRCYYCSHFKLKRRETKWY